MVICKRCGGRVRRGVCNVCDMLAARKPPGGAAPDQTWVSEGMAVAPDQIPDALARNKRHGVRVEYDALGRAVCPDRNERKKLLRLEGMHDKQGGYGD